MSKLNLCPICGSEVESNVSFGTAQINCKNHECIMIGCIMMNEPFADEIEKKWNESYSNQELAKLREENEKLKFQLDVAEAVLSVQVTRSALAYFEDKIKSLENNVTEH